MNNTTHSVKLNEIEKKWYVIDAANKPLGRVATEAAKLLNLEDALITEGKIPCKGIKMGESIHVAMDSKTAPPGTIDLNQIRLLIESIGWD